MRIALFLLMFLPLATWGETAFRYTEPSFLYGADIDESIRPLEPEELAEKVNAANAGDQEAQYVLGYMYEYGTDYSLGVHTNYTIAERWYLKAAEAGQTKSMLALGRLYKKGGQAGFARNVPAAIKWFKAAAKAGDPEGLYELGIIYELGDTLEQSDEKALEVYKLASGMGLLKAQVKAALFHQHGRGTAQNLREAIRYFRMAVEGAKAQPEKQEKIIALLGLLYAQIGDAQKTTNDKLKWHILAAENRNIESQLFLADTYMAKKQEDKKFLDVNEAVRWYKIAAEQENVYAMEQLGYIYGNGIGIPRDYKEAYAWYLKAASKGSPDAAWNLGSFYLNGLGVERNEAEAQKWFKRSNVLQRRKTG